MCQFYTAVITRSSKVLDAFEIDDSHESVIEKHKLADDKLKDRDFVRVELTPPSTDISNLDGWNYKIDEPDTLPGWYDGEKAESAVRRKLRGLVGKVLFFEGDHVVESGRVYCADNASAELFGNASAELSDNASARLFDNASARLFGNASAELFGNASARLFDNASAELFDNASARLSDNASAELFDNASATSWGHKRVCLAQGSLTVLIDRRNRGVVSVRKARK